MAQCERCGREIKEGRRFCSMGRGRDKPGCADAWMLERTERFGGAKKPPDGVTYERGKAANDG